LKEQLAYQEYVTILEDLDKQVRTSVTLPIIAPVLTVAITGRAGFC